MTREGTAPAGRRSEVLRVLRESGEAMSITAIAGRLRVHPNTVRFHLDSLIEAGRVEQVRTSPSRPGRPAQMFRPRPGMDPAGRRNYPVLADMLLTGLLDGAEPEAAAQRVGHRWGLGSALIARGDDPAEASAGLVRVLAEIGFAPAADRAGAIAIGNCPFLELVEKHGTSICAMHLGFMRGVMERAGDPLRIVDLIPFEEPDRCRVITATS